MNTRASGILLHPTSLPNSDGIGTLGVQAFKFVDWLESAGQTLWQILPFGPTGYGDSPYASFSTFAGNPLLIDLDKLEEDGWLSSEQKKAPDYIKNSGYIDFGSVVWWKIPVLKLAAKQFLEKGKTAGYEKFLKKNDDWLESYATFMAIKDSYDGKLWFTNWKKPLVIRDEKALEEFSKTHFQEIEEYKAIQFFFFEQWAALKKYAASKNIKIIGDIPIFVAPDSSDVWANQAQFQLEKSGKPKVVAGVPPDYFSATGQLWGNPLYNWKAMKKDGYRWWLKRISHCLKMVDYVRIDHFRGFEAYWAVPYGAENAVIGEWEKGPDHDLFKTIKKELGEIPIIAEDLGLITPEVQKLREDFDLPGMKVLQFAFDLNEENTGCLKNSFLPHEYGTNFVVYTGTHDNETMQGFLDNISEGQKLLIKKYLSGNISIDKKLLSELIPDSAVCPLLIREAFASTARMCVIPFQDVFSIGNEGRMNTPSTQGGHNWQWRMNTNFLDDEISIEKAQWLKELSILFDRNRG